MRLTLELVRHNDRNSEVDNFDADMVNKKPQYI